MFQQQRCSLNEDQSSECNMSSSIWRFRPSALIAANNVFISQSSREKLEDFYEDDNRSAQQAGVTILPRYDSSRIRTLQWNINSGYYHYKDQSSNIINAIRNADADVIVLNEYCNEKSFEDDLKAAGYSYSRIGTVDYPTAIATRLKVLEEKEIILSYDRSALLIKAQASGAEENSHVWVIGTHINFMSGTRRNEEMQVLLKKLTKKGLVSGGSTTTKTNERIVLVGDLNQQRERDYSPEEWERILAGMEHRRSCVDDGVYNMLSDHGFVCVWDQRTSSLTTNWEGNLPPATHWSGTIVDYSYGYNVDPVAVSIGADSSSDHRMTVCDWSW